MIHQKQEMFIPSLHLLLLPLLLSTASAQYIFEAAWSSDIGCASAPTRMLVYPTTGQTTTYYQFFTNQIHLPICGFDPILNSMGCCAASLDTTTLTGSGGYLSGSVASLTTASSASILAAVPSLANSHTYCSLAPSSTASTYPYTQGYYLAQGTAGSCLDGFTCSATGVLSSYSTANCSDASPTVVTLSSSTSQTFTSPGGMGVTASLYTWTGTSNTYTWVAYIPGDALVPDYSIPADTLGVIAICVSMAFSLGVTFWYIRNYFKGDYSAYSIVLTQVMWFIWVTGILLYWLKPQAAYDFVEWMEFLDAFYNALSLISVVITIKMLFKYFVVNSQLFHNTVWIALGLIHLGTAGGNYINYLEYNSNVGVDEFALAWAAGFPWWNVFQYACNTIPPMVIVYRVALLQVDKHNLSGMKEAYTKIHFINPAFFPLLSVQCVNTVLYGVFGYFAYYSNILGNDKNYVAVDYGLLSLLNIDHELLNVFLVLILQSIIKRIRDEDRGRDPAPSLMSKDRLLHGSIGSGTVSTASSPFSATQGGGGNSLSLPGGDGDRRASSDMSRMSQIGRPSIFESQPEEQSIIIMDDDLPMFSDVMDMAHQRGRRESVVLNVDDFMEETVHVHVKGRSSAVPTPAKIVPDNDDDMPTH